MNQYVITYSDEENLFDRYQTIEGNTGILALNKFYNKKFKRVFGDNARYANVIIVKGFYDKLTNLIVYKGKFQRLCYCYEEEKEN